MSTFEAVARGILDEWFAPAMTLEEFLVELERDHPELRTDAPRALRTLERADGIRVIRRPASAEPADFGPVAWVLCYRPNRMRPLDPCLVNRRLRESVIAIGRTVRTDALASWARWNQLAFGALNVCATLSRPTERKRSGARRWSDPRGPAVRQH